MSWRRCWPGTVLVRRYTPVTAIYTADGIVIVGRLNSDILLLAIFDPVVASGCPALPTLPFVDQPCTCGSHFQISSSHTNAMTVILLFWKNKGGKEEGYVRPAPLILLLFLRPASCKLLHRKKEGSLAHACALRRPNIVCAAPALG